MEKTAPAVVVLDLSMPDMGGHDLLGRLRAIPHMRDVPVVIWTVEDPSTDDRRRLLRTAQRIVLKGHGRSSAILDALKPYLRVNLPEDANVG